MPLPSEMRAGSVKLRGLSFFYKSNLDFLDADADDGDRFNWFIASNFNYDAACSSWVGTGLDWTGLDSDEFPVQNSWVWHLSPTWNADDFLHFQMAVRRPS